MTMHEPPLLLAVPNVSEGRDLGIVARIGQAFTAKGSVKLLDIHTDADHHRSVFTLAGGPETLSDALLGGVAIALQQVDISDERGAHPHVGAVDVVPMVYLSAAARGLACAQALVVGDRIGEELGVPVFLYGELTEADDTPARTRAQLRQGGIKGLVERMRAGECQPDFGPSAAHPTAGVTLVCAREPLVAFNLQLKAPAALRDARRIAGLIREGAAAGLPGLRAIGVQLRAPVAADQPPIAQVSMNVERPLELPLAQVLGAVARHAEVSSAEIVGLAPKAALEGFPADLPMLGFQPERQLIENALGL
jgi:glutamate formiminotransferase / 5-formyltetrahydrofolate cyclo-ligase